MHLFEMYFPTVGKLCGDLGTFRVSGLGVVGIWVGLAAFRAPTDARTLLGIWVGLCGDLGTSIVSGLGVVGIWAGSGSIPGACRRPDAAGDLGSPELAGHL